MSRLTAEDLAANPKLRRAVTAAVARDLASGTRPGADATPPRPERSDLPKGRGGTHRCAICQLLHPSYAKAERHADTHGGGRIDLEL